VIAVLDYGIGNLRSAQKALQRVGGDAVLVTDPAAAMGADGVVLPGVGAFGPCVAALRASGLDQVALEAIDAGLPFIGICVGLQVLYEKSEEAPGIPGLGVLPGTVRALPAGVKRPQMQWNPLQPTPVVGRGLLAGLGPEPWVYFVHSYAVEMSADTRASGDIVATCDYGGPMVAALERDRLWATQFHPEKSGPVGLAVLANFVRTCQAP